MAVLAIDTTTTVAAVAVIHQGQVLSEVTLGVQRNHAARILPAIDMIMRESGVTLQELSHLAVSVGPGSFTGQRIGLSLAKGMAEGLGIKIVPVSTLRLLAEQLSTHNGVIVPLLDAQREQYYMGVFVSRDGLVSQMADDQAVHTGELMAHLEGYDVNSIMLTGEAATIASKQYGLKIAPAFLRIPRASVLGLMTEASAGTDPKVIAPNYIRPSSAKPSKGCG